MIPKIYCLYYPPDLFMNMNSDLTEYTIGLKMWNEEIKLLIEAEGGEFRPELLKTLYMPDHPELYEIYKKIFG